MDLNGIKTNTQINQKNDTPPQSIFRLNLIELLLGLVTGGLVTLSFRNTLWSLEPITGLAESHYGWFTGARSDLLWSLGWFYFLLGFVSAVSLIRLLRKQHHLVPRLGRISPWGYTTLIWPLLLLIPGLILFFNFSAIICWPVALVIAMLICVYSVREFDNRGDWFPLLFNLVASLPLLYNNFGVWVLIGD